RQLVRPERELPWQRLHVPRRSRARPRLDPRACAGKRARADPDHLALALVWRAVSRPQIVPYSQHWPAAFQAMAKKIRAALGPEALRIDPIGSTAVAGLPAKNVIDIQVAVSDLGDADPLASAGFRPFAGVVDDHRPPGDERPDAEWSKRLFLEPPDERRANVHVRVLGTAN